MSSLSYQQKSKNCRTRLRAFALVILGCFYLLPLACAQEPASAQQIFKSPNAAVGALVAATESDQMNTLSSILGPDANEILASGDPVADANARAEFVRRYREMHRLAYDDQGHVILYIGAENWPTPIPLIKKDGGWVFDTASGKDELLYRRVGRNELFTIHVLEDLADAQLEYASESHDDNDSGQFARKILSDTGRQNGLYWTAAEGQPESPIGPLVAQAAAEGYGTKHTPNPVPFHGYYYSTLARQGTDAPGGARDYLVHGKMTKGFAFIAYPAEYRASGVMTFMINQNGVIVQKDLGPDTVQSARAITEFNPDHTWDEVNEQ
jgi:hypothetical protein